MTGKPADGRHPDLHLGTDAREVLRPAGDFYASLGQLDLLRRAFAEVQRRFRLVGSGASMPQTVEQEDADAILRQLSKDLQARSYRLSPTSRTSGDALRDQVVQAAFKLLFAPSFAPAVPCGAQPKEVLEWVSEAVERGLTLVLALDLKVYLDVVPDDRLVAMFRQRIPDAEPIDLLEHVLAASPEPSDRRLLAPLLADVACHGLDSVLQQARAVGRRETFSQVECARLGMDLVILVRPDPAFAWVLPSIKKRLGDELSKLNVDSHVEETPAHDLAKGERLQLLGFEIYCEAGIAGTPRVHWQRAEKSGQPAVANVVARKKKPIAKNSSQLSPPVGRLQPFWAKYAAALSHVLASTLELAASAATRLLPRRGRSSPTQSEAPKIQSEPDRWHLAWARLCAFLASDWRALPAALVASCRYCRRHWDVVALVGCGGAVLVVVMQLLDDLPAERAVPGEPPGFYSCRYLPAEADRPVHYALYVPPSFKKAQGPFPLIVSLNDLGDPNQPLLWDGLASSVRKAQMAHAVDFVVFFPFNLNGHWARRGEVNNLLEVLDHVIKRHRIDPKRVHLMGHGQAGCELWTLAARYPERWAAIVAISPLCLPPPGTAPQLPCWVFHGEADRRAPVQAVRDRARALGKKGLDVAYTEYPRGGDQIWRQVYDTPGVYQWLATKSKP